MHVVFNEILTANKQGTKIQFEVEFAHVTSTSAGHPRCRGAPVGAGSVRARLSPPLHNRPRFEYFFLQLSQSLSLFILCSWIITRNMIKIIAKQNPLQQKRKSIS